MNRKQKGSDFESYVAHIYDNLLKLENDNSQIFKNFKFKVHNVTHEIDIYYKFSKASIQHRVAIECKNWDIPVHQKEVASFDSVLNSIKNITGVMVSKNGYTSGAKEYAKERKIQLVEIKQLPNFLKLMGLRLMQTYMPSPDAIAEPFYTMFGSNQNNTWDGNYIIDRYSPYENHPIMHLFLSRKVGEEFIQLTKRDDTIILPLKRGHLNYIIEISEKIEDMNDLHFGLHLYPFLDPNKKVMVISSKDLKEAYLQ